MAFNPPATSTFIKVNGKLTLSSRGRLSDDAHENRYANRGLEAKSVILNSVTTLDDLLAVENITKYLPKEQTLEHLAGVLKSNGMDLEKLQAMHAEGRPEMLKKLKAWGIRLGDAQLLATCVGKTRPCYTSAKYTRDLTHPAYVCLLYTSPSPRDGLLSRMPSSA